MQAGPTMPISQEIHAQKYRGPGETFRDAMGRVAEALSDNDPHYHTLREVLLEQRFMPGGRVQAAAGSPKRVTAYNCFVSATLEDSFVDGAHSIMNCAAAAAQTMRMGGGIGYDFSTLRPRGATIKKLGSVSSGPIAFMEIFDAVCRCVASSGHRRGAQMGVMRIDHPDIEEFIHIKHNQGTLSGFNLSIAVTDEFMRHLKSDKPFALRWQGQVYREVDPVALWKMVMRSTWDWAEPGVLFIDTINRMNNLSYCEQIAATNPCGEQPLPPHGACLLGSFNLVKYLVQTEDGSGYRFNTKALQRDIPPIVRAMDNVIDHTLYPLYEQEKEARHKRRMGLGVTGLANALEACGHPYASDGFLEMQRNILRTIRDGCYRASAQLAKEKGCFPLFDRDAYLASPFVQKLPENIRDDIAAYGIRNSHLTSIAPTGTISLSADNVSSGIEPVFCHRYERTVQTFDGPRQETVEDYGVAKLGVYGKVASAITPSEHLAVLATAQEMVDSAVSKTCNIGDDVTWQQFNRLYLDAWEMGCKGCTTFRAAGKRMGILQADSNKTTQDIDLDDLDTSEAANLTTSPEAACRIDPVTGRHECD